MAITVDISDWESEDWDVTIPEMLDWIHEKGSNTIDVWPDTRHGLLHFSDVNDAIEFILKWS